METLALVLQSAPESALIGLLIERMNGLRSAVNTTAEERAAFNRAVTLLAEFREQGMASWAEQSDNPGRYELILSDYAPAHITEAEELLRLLDVRGEPRRESTIRIPAIVGVRSGNFDDLAIQTRSVAELMRAAAASIDVPREHIEEHIVSASPGAGAVFATPAPILRILSSRNAPDRPNVAVQHRGWWYYIDDADLASKRTFLQIEMFFSMRLSQATRGTQATPLLTIPVK